MNRDTDISLSKVSLAQVIGFVEPSTKDGKIEGHSVIILYDDEEYTVPISPEEVHVFETAIVNNDTKVFVVGPLKLAHNNRNLTILPMHTLSKERRETLFKKTLKEHPSNYRAKKLSDNAIDKDNVFARFLSPDKSSTNRINAKRIMSGDNAKKYYSSWGEHFLYNDDSSLHINNDKVHIKTKGAGQKISRHEVAFDGNVKESGTPDSHQYAHLSLNPFMFNLGPSTTMLPYPQYLINFDTFTVGAVGIIQAIGYL